jgi:hypothetical protein
LRGVGLSVSDADVEDEDEVLEAVITDGTCEQMVETARDAGAYVEPYPLADKKTGKKHRAGVIGLWRALIDKTKNEEAFDNVLLPWCIEWQCIMSSSMHRGLRHTGTEVAMALMVRLTELLVELETQQQAKQRQQASQGGKKGASGMAALVEQEIDKLKTQVEALRELLQTVFKGVFIERYRDSCDEIRVCCLSGLGRAMCLHEGVFLHDTYLKYFGWMLNDTAALVRATTVGQLHHVYKAHGEEHTDRLTNFTHRFEGRLVEMSRDVDTKVSVEAIKLINTLHELELLADKKKAVEEAMQVMRLNELSQLKALVPLVNKHMARADGDGADPGTAKASKKSKKGAAAAATADQPLVQLAKLAWGSAGEVERLPEVCGRIVASMRPLTPALSDWAAYTNLLTGETLDEEDVHHLQCVLVHLMAASAVHTNEGAAAAAVATEAAEAQTPRKKARRAPTRKEIEAHDEGTVALSAELGRSLAALLEKFGAQADVLQPLLTLVRQLQLQSAASALKGGVFGALLDQLDACFFKHNTTEAMRAHAAAWAELVTQPGAPALQEQARVRFKKLVNKLVASLKPLSAFAAKPKGGAFAFDEASVAMRRIAHLVSAYPDASTSLRTIDDVPERLLPLLDTRSGSEPGLAACITAMLQLKTTVLTARVAEARMAANVGQGGAALELDETLLQQRDEALPLLATALDAPVAPVAEVAAGCLSLLLGTVLPKLQPDSDDPVLQEASDALLSWFSATLQAVAAGEQDGEPQEAPAQTSDLPGPRWLSDVVGCALLHGVPTAPALCTLLHHLGDLPDSFRVFAKQLWLNHLSVVHSTEALAELELQILREAGLPTDSDEKSQLEAVAHQLGQLNIAASVTSSRSKERLSEMAFLLLDTALEQALASDEADSVSFVELGLVPMLSAIPREQAERLHSKYEDKITHVPRFARRLREACTGEGGRRSGEGGRRSTEGGKRSAEGGKKRKSSVGRAPAEPRASRSGGRSRRAEKRRLPIESEDEAEEEQNEEEAAGSADEGALEYEQVGGKAVQGQQEEEEEEEEPWDGEGVEDMDIEDEDGDAPDEGAAEGEEEGEEAGGEVEEEGEEVEEGEEGEDEEAETGEAAGEEDEGEDYEAVATDEELLAPRRGRAALTSFDELETASQSSAAPPPTYAYARAPRRRA